MREISGKGCTARGGSCTRGELLFFVEGETTMTVIRSVVPACASHLMTHTFATGVLDKMRAKTR